MTAPTVSTRRVTTPAAKPTRDWRTQAACRNEDPELFFPVGTTGLAIAQAEEAKAVCARCPVRVHCLDWALSARPEQGVWGGFTEDERNKLLRRRRSPAYADTVPASWPTRPRWAELLTYRGLVEAHLTAGVSQRRIAASLGFDRELLSELVALIRREQNGKAA